MTTARRLLPYAALALAVVVLGLVARNGRNDGEPLDPRSTGPLGARGLVLVLERFGADVRLDEGPRPPAGAVAVVLEDRLSETERGRLERWVVAGGTMVVADPTSGLAPTLDRVGAGLLGAVADRRLEPDCDLAAVSQIDHIDVSGGAAYRRRAGDVACFPLRGGSFLLARRSGAGTVVALGGAGPFVNRRLDEADNSVLAVSLLAPGGAGSVVSFVAPSAAGTGATSLRDLVSPRVKDGLWQLLIAFVLFALWRARRLGRPVTEPQPVQIAGSELVVAVGNLLHRGRRRDSAAAMLRSSLRRTLSERLGVPVDAPPDTFAAAVSAARTGVDPAAVASALGAVPPADDAALVQLAQSVESIRNEVAHAR